jgi:hypothetical protein
VPVNHLDLQDREQRRERRALRAEGIKPLACRMKPWSPLVVAPIVLDMVKTGTLSTRFAWQPKPRSSVPTCHSRVALTPLRP